MAFFHPEPKSKGNKTAILLLNLGTPKCPNKRALKGYLQEFLSDRRVVELPRWLWLALLKLVILPFRSGKSAAIYQKIWTEQGSPLAFHMRNISEKLQIVFDSEGILVDYAMSYGAPSVSSVITKLKNQGAGSLLVVPLFPQYAASSTGAALDKVLQTLLRQRHQLAVHTVTQYHNHPLYIKALAQHIAQSLQQHQAENFHLLMSFHGIPETQHQAGDPYAASCEETARLLAQALKRHENSWEIAYQSQFGKAKWLTPSTQTLLDTLAPAGKKELALVCPGFATDCLETLEEINIVGREAFLASGGEKFHYIESLNSSEAWILALEGIIREHLPKAWLRDSAGEDRPNCPK